MVVLQYLSLILFTTCCKNILEGRNKQFELIDKNENKYGSTSPGTGSLRTVTLGTTFLVTLGTGSLENGSWVCGGRREIVQTQSDPSLMYKSLHDWFSSVLKLSIHPF